MARSIKVYAAVLGADLLSLGTEVRSVEAGGADGIHIDVLDGHSTPYITFGPKVVESIRGATHLPLNVHLMIEKPERFIYQFAMAGADRISFDVQIDNPPATIDGIREAGRLVGISLRPGVAVDDVLPYIELVDMILVMSTDPSARGHPFVPEALEKLVALRQSGFTGELAVYGGLNEQHAARAREAGATVLVSGSCIFKARDRARRIAALRGA
ncbi:MAG: ribulose-phosphate 3-epimerase [Planctomycetes bacterium]|nr:ribulose-phosphate 3-epimerase [Planctomycetota bacterium]